MKTIFEKIIDGEISSKKVFENKKFIAIEDIAPKAPFHFLIIPKKKYKDLQSIPVNELTLVTEIATIAQKLASEHKIESYRLLTNIGEDAGQTIFHLHFHLIGGSKLGQMA